MQRQAARLDAVAKQDAGTDRKDGAERDAVPARAVRVWPLNDGLELRFGRGFDARDIAIVKSIPGRRYAPDRTTWQLPHTAKVIDTRRASFGPRLILPEVAPAAATTSGIAEPDVAGLIDTMRRAILARGYSRKTELAYVAWVRRFLQFSGDVAGSEHLRASHAHAFLVHLAQRRLAAKSRNQAASALAFMFREVLGRDEMADVARAKGPSRMPVVLRTAKCCACSAS